MMIAALSSALIISVYLVVSLYKKNKMYKEAARLSESDLISDLDELITKKVAFKYLGKLFHIKALSLEQFFAVTGTLAKLDNLKTRKIKSEEQLMEVYQELFDAAIDEKLAAKDMSYQQIAALFNLILESVMGKAQVTAEKKKQLTKKAS
jgi:hypothetical protein